jgi:glycosyltransferase involved in cell wall biosynthesis
VKPPRILFVARPVSVHAARWINQIADRGWDLHLFPAFDAPIHQDFGNITTYSLVRDRSQELHRSIRERVLWPLPRGVGRLRALARRAPAHWSSRAAWLARVINSIKPDLIHTLEFQLAGYLTVEAKSYFKGRFPAWAASNWGSDIYLYGPLSKHAGNIKAILSNCDYYACECHRDVTLAREYGFKGEVLPVLPIAGGFHIETMRQYTQPGLTSARRLIAIKGYQHWAGRALAGLRAIELCADELKSRGFRVAVYLANPDVEIAAERMACVTGLPVDIIPPSTHEEMLRLHGRARVSIGLSISDGLSTSALEALLMGAFPIQSNTSCLTDLVRDGETALMVPPEDPTEIAAAIRRAIADDALVDRASELNYQMAAKHLDYEIVRSQVVAMYERVVAQQRAKGLAG